MLEAEKEWALAHLKTDINVLDSLMHPDYSILRPDGRVWDKEKALASYVPGKRDWVEARSSEHIVNIYGSTAIVIGLWRARGVNNGEPFDYCARYTAVWVRSDGELRIVSDHSTETQ